MALLHNPFTGDNEPCDRDSEPLWSDDAIAYYENRALEQEAEDAQAERELASADPSLHTYDGPPPAAVRDAHGATLAQPFTWYED